MSITTTKTVVFTEESDGTTISFEPDGPSGNWRIRDRGASLTGDEAIDFFNACINAITGVE